jgi:hypothetical protein
MTKKGKTRSFKNLENLMSDWRLIARPWVDLIEGGAHGLSLW